MAARRLHNACPTALQLTSFLAESILYGHKASPNQSVGKSIDALGMEMTSLLRMSPAHLDSTRIAIGALLYCLGVPIAATAECPLVTASEAIVNPHNAVVFQGTVTEIKDASVEVHQVVTFEVARVWKGTPSKQESFYQRNTSAAIKFTKGSQFFVVASREIAPSPPLPPTMPEIIPCGTFSLEQPEQREELLRQIGPGRVLR